MPKLISQTLSQPPNLRNTNHLFWNSKPNYISLYICAVTFNRTAEISKFLATKNRPNWTWPVCESSDCSTDWTKDVNNETITMSREPQEESLDRVSESYFYLGYYCLYIILFGPNVINPFQFDALPTTKFLLFPLIFLWQWYSKSKPS